MKRYLSVLVLLLAILPLLGAQPAQAAERPFHLYGSGTVSPTGEIQAQGHATFLGLYTETGSLSFAPDPNDPTRALASGSATFTAANGDQLNGVITDASIDLATGAGTGVFRIEGGTGRFQNATGTVAFAVQQNFATGAFEITGIGSIDF